jgi:hypothetical protein
VPAAVAAKNELDGKNIYAGCCTLSIQYSSMKDLNIKYNTDKTRYVFIVKHVNILNAIDCVFMSR